MKINCYHSKDNIYRIACILITKNYLAGHKVLVLANYEKIQSLSELLWVYSDEFVAHSTILDEGDPILNPVFISDLESRKFHIANSFVFCDISLNKIENFYTQYFASEPSSDLKNISLVSDQELDKAAVRNMFNPIFQKCEIHFYENITSKNWKKEI